MPLPIQQPLLARPHNNQQLFSDHYLDAILPNRADWQTLASQAKPVMREITAIYTSYQPSSNEAQTEENLIRPILKALGHPYEVQTPLKTPDGTKTPDYILYRDVAALSANKGKVLTDELPQQGAYAVADAKYWERPLDQTIKAKGGDVFTNKNPSYQIAFYIQHTGLEWGILTNGRKWRLYHKSSAHKLDRFYEVDLPELLENGDPARFLYFYLFFYKSSFEPHPLGVSAILEESADYARGVGNTLKTQVYDALRHLAQGFLDYAPNELQTDPATLKQIYDASLIVLYRTLFILYAEARDLLPLYESPTYRKNYSLDSIKKRTADELDAGTPFLVDTAMLWPRFKALFGIINTGSPPLHVATFNGGLFDPKKHPFLEQYTVGDSHLQQALDKLARVDRQFIDYRDLAVRHLGTIYEGLLEYHLEPLSTGGKDGWSVDLLNDKGERKATGSYYTPDYIVKYIVEQTLGPVLESNVTGLEEDAAKVEAVLATNVLDPAMGSGHFLVEATEYIARYLVEMGVHPEGSTSDETELAYWKRRVVQSCIYGVDLNPLAVELAKLSLWLATVAKDRPLSFLDHHLRAGNSLIGARISDLWLGTGSIKKTVRLSKKEREARKAAEAGQQASMLDDETFMVAMSGAVGSMLEIEENPSLTVQQVKEQEAAYHELRERLTRKYGRLADFVTATHFGLKADVTGEQWRALADYATGQSVAAPAQFVRWLEEADAIAGQRRFFHWELEFPEVFFDRKGKSRGDDAGFDAVIGNPPYIRQEALGAVKPYLAASYEDVYHGTADIFVYFIGQGLGQMRKGGRLSYISSNSWLRANYATPLRSYLRTKATIEKLVDLGDNRVFADAPDVYPAILVIRQDEPPKEYIADVAVFTRGEGLTLFASKVQRKLARVSIHDQDDTGWQLGDDLERQIFQKLMSTGKPLGEVINGQMYYGVKTGLNEAFIIDQATRDRLVMANTSCTEIIRPLINGEDVRPWIVEDEGRWLILLADKWTATEFGSGLSEEDAWTQLQGRYPSIAAHLAPYAEPARKRTDKGEYWWELRPCTYYSDFDGHKIFWPEMAKQPRYATAYPGVVGNKTTFMIPGERPYLLGLLMSRTLWFAVTKLCVPIGERKGMLRYTLSGQFMARLPIVEASKDEQECISKLAIEATEHAHARYKLHDQTRHRLLVDLGTSSKSLNQKLTSWWELDFAGLRAELQKVFKRDIPLKERDEWEEWFAEQRSQHENLTREIVRLETSLNTSIYAVYGLGKSEVEVVERATKFQYGTL